MVDKQPDYVCMECDRADLHVHDLSPKASRIDSPGKGVDHRVAVERINIYLAREYRVKDG